ncbi:MAG: TonB-dependent receptor plug domain-containing protein [Terrimonas sp.]|nr:TonB-dependent receptor plug domain-containing protein [Terrimonas sp.]
MPLLFSYIIKLSISLAVIYIFYSLILRRLTFYHWNRLFLLGYTVFCFFIPLVNISPVLQKNELADLNLVGIIPSFDQLSTPLLPSADSGLPRTWQLFLWIGVIGVLVLTLRLLIQFLSYTRLKATARLIPGKGVRIYQVDKDIIPFSFGSSIFINTTLHTEDELQEVIRHEFVHVSQRHSIDIIWSEILCILNWYNPFVWLLRKSIRQNLEFIADQQVVKNGIDKKKYQYLLLKVIGNNAFSIANQFNFSTLKKRIAMMNKNRTPRVHLFRFLFLLPVVVFMLLAFRNTANRDPLPVEFHQQESLHEADTTPAPSVPPPPPPLVLKPNTKGHVITIADNNGESVVIIKDQKNKIIKAIQLEEWNRNEKYFTDRYGPIPPPPPPVKPVAKIRPVQPPLYIIDGKPMKEGKSVDDAIKPEEIERVDVLKGESAVKKYGPKGENGVIEITSKQSLSLGDFSGLVIIDGKELPKNQKLEAIISSPDEIESMNVLKGDKAVLKYGERGRNGVIEITIKPSVQQ